MGRKSEISAGLLVYRNPGNFEVLLAHPGGPYWARKDAGAWTIPKGLVEPGDVVVMISGSGRSPNILRATETARACGAVTVGLTGSGGGQLKNLVDVCVLVPSNRMELIEDVHAVLMHALCQELRRMVRETAVLSALAAR